MEEQLEVPAQLLVGLTATELATVRAWWAGLAEANQSELAALCDARRDASFFGPDDGNGNARLPRVFGGRFVPDKDTSGWEEWRAELFEYLVCHPEFAEPQVVRIFRIGCARHLLSRGMLETVKGRLDFECPVGSEKCPIRSLLNLTPNQALQQTGAASRLSEALCLSSGPGC